MAVREINIAENWDAARELMAANWRETGDAFPFAPAREFFERLQAGGFMVAFGAYSGNALVGYAGVTISPHPFNPEVLTASVNPLYVAPEHRRGILPGRLIATVRAAARERGAHRLYWHMRAGTAGAQMLAAHGCEMVDNVMAEDLTHGG